MKKVPILISTLIFGAIFSTLFSAKTQALYIDDTGQTWWTAPELLEYKKLVDADEKNNCPSSDKDCLKAYRDNKRDNDPKYRALQMLQGWQIAITGIDFKNETIKLVIFDEDMTLRNRGEDARYGVELNQFFVAWFDNEEASNNFHIAIRNPERLMAEGAAGTHVLLGFYGDEAKKLIKDQEVEYLMASGSNIVNNKGGYYRYNARANYFNKSTYADYFRCTWAEDYPDGECVMIFTSNRSDYMFVASPKASDAEIDDPVVEPPADDSSDKTSGSGEDSPGKSTDDGMDSTLVESMPGTEDKGVNSAPDMTHVKAPNTGEFTNVNEACQKNIEFPWWIIGFIVFGDLAALWLFFPRKNRV